MCESPLEADAVFWAESDAAVVEIVGQPLRIETSFGTRSHYTFDLEIRYATGENVLCEVKPTNKLIRSEEGDHAPAYWCDVRLWCDSNGHSCRVITEETLCEHAQLIENFRCIVPFARRAFQNPDPDVSSQILADVTREPGQSIRSVLAHYGASSAQQLEHLCYLLHQGRISADLATKPVTLDSVLLPVS